VKRKPILAANWKMNILPSESEKYLSEFLPLVKNQNTVEIVLCPTAITLDRVSHLLVGTNVLLGGQNIHSETSGAFTGENSAPMLKDLHCRYVILGHSERRTLFHETNEDVNKKIKKAQEFGLSCIVCVGETLAEREAGKMEQVVQSQIEASLKNLTPIEIQKIVIAYEPVWAIGTGRNATPDQAQEAHAFIRHWLQQRFDASIAQAVRIQYGGSVNATNAASLLQQPDVDGALVGGASLKAETFSAIVKAAVEAKVVTR
jgi:triosephosphate isomerase